MLIKIDILEIRANRICISFDTRYIDINFLTLLARYEVKDIKIRQIFLSAL